MDLAYLIAHPQELNQETLYDLRRLVAIYPTYHAARILFLQNLFLLHDPSFDQELRRAALLVPDRRVLFGLTHNIPTLTAENNKATTQHPDTTNTAKAPAATPTGQETEALPKTPQKKYATTDTTARLLDNFLDTTPKPLAKKRIKADPATDYMAYLLQQEDDQPEPLNTPSRLDDLIDSFIASSEEGIKLSEDPMIPEEFQEQYLSQEEEEEEESLEPDVAPEPEEEPEPEEVQEPEEPSSSSELSEQLAQIYIKQGKYERAMEILNKISVSDKKAANPYLADQIRFLKKLAAIHAKKQ